MKIKFKPTNIELTGSKSGCKNNFILIINITTSSNPPSCAYVKAPDSVRALTMKVFLPIFRIMSFIVGYVILVLKTRGAQLLSY